MSENAFFYLDTTGLIFWSVTYLLICFESIRYRDKYAVCMPYFTGCLNFAWEFRALFLSGGFWGHIAWLGLDVIILFMNLRSLRQTKKKIFYGCFVFVCILAFFYISRLNKGMLISSFIIDFILSMDYFMMRKKLYFGSMKKIIAATKLVGDFFAWMAYGPINIFIAVIGAFVFIINISYLIYCLMEKRQYRQREEAKQKRKEQKKASARKKYTENKK